MSIPDFTKRGVLPKGIHTSSPKEFVDKFCSNELSEYRFNYIPIIDNLLGYCHERGAFGIFFISFQSVLGWNAYESNNKKINT